MTSNNPQSPTTTSPHVVLVVIYSLAILSMLGFIGTFLLVRGKFDGASIAVFSGLSGTALGGLMSALNNTRTSPQPKDAQPEEVTPTP